MKLDHFVLLSSNLADSARFYSILLTRLGFTKVREWVWMDRDGISIDLRAAESGLRYERYAPGLNHFAFSVDDQPELERLVTELAEAGIEVPPIQTFEDGQAVFISDPDGLRIELGWEQ